MTGNAAQANSAKGRPIALTRLKSQLRPTEEVGTALYGVVCISPRRITWADAAPAFVNLTDIFLEELKAAGLRPSRDPENLFADRERIAGDLEVGAIIKGMDASFCEDLVHISGKIKLDIQWQVYSSVEQRVLASIETHEMAQKSKGSVSKNQGRSLSQMAFAANAKALITDPAFRKIVSTAEPSTAYASPQIDSAVIQLTGAPKTPTAIPDAVGSVVSIFAGDAFGSGVLVSSDGYVLTNHHVVADAKIVKVRWSDGFESSGQVLRSDRHRDVALVKVENRGRTALAINRIPPPAGTPVFAIGTPLDPGLRNTVTRGIVSANRIVDGFNFIQSDTPVTHGNSGGPLLDEHGAVVGLTDWGVPNSEGSSLNFFIPIGDALDFLGLKSSQ